MLNRIIEFSLNNRIVILVACVALIIFGGRIASELPVDVFPDLNRPTVSILTEAAGLAPEEVEVQVTRPLEYLLNGATGVQRVRSASGIGLSIVWVEFDWGSDIYRDRQIVSDALALARERLPRDVSPEIAPIASIMGEIMLLGLHSTGPPGSAEEQTKTAMELRDLAELTLKPRLRSVAGIAQVTVIGGVLRQYQVVTSPARLAAQNITLDQLVDAARDANVIAGGGIQERSTTESLIRIVGRSVSLPDIEETVVAWRENRPVLIRDVADVKFGGPVRRGAASVRVKPTGGNPGALGATAAVILTIQKQPHVNTLTLDRTLGEVLDEIQDDLPKSVGLERDIFKQADFIRAAIGNVEEAIRDGAVWVFLILFLFLMNLRTSLITLTAIPLSLLVTALVFHVMGITLNTMTLGGIAVAVGELVDDAIVDIENIYRRLRENRAKDKPESLLRVIYLASTEVRNSVVYATLIVCLVVLPLFALGGLEGRMFAPLGLGYLISLGASLLISLTVTPVLASFLLQPLPGLPDPLAQKRDPFLLRWLKRGDERLVRFSLKHRHMVLAVVALLVVLSVVSIFGMGGAFLPAFNEGTLTINVTAEPGTGLAESERLGQRMEELLLEVPEVLSVARRTGRAEKDEHAEGVNSSELDVRLQEYDRPKAGVFFALVRAIPGLHSFGVADGGRPRAVVLADIRDRVTRLPGVKVNIGQPIGHRLDHLLSGVRAQVAVKVFGPDLQTLRTTAADVEDQMRKVPGIVDLQTEPQVDVPQLLLKFNRTAAKAYGLRPGDVARLLETAYKGKTVSEILDEERRFDLVVWYDEASRNDPEAIRSTILDTTSGRKVALGQVVDVVPTTGPNTLGRENVQRRIVISCNVQGRDLVGAVAEIKAKLAGIESRLHAQQGYRLEYSGQFEAQEQANRQLLLLGVLAVIGVFLLLYMALESWWEALQVMANIPLAAIGSVVALVLTNWPSAAELARAAWWQWPGVWLAASHLTVAHWVGFITLIGIVSRNGILMISHYLHLMKHEGEDFTEAMIVRGSLERLAPVLMTASVAIMGLVPLALGAGQTGKEILQPLAVVVIGGLIASTLLDQMVTPALFWMIGKKPPVPAAV